MEDTEKRFKQKLYRRKRDK